MNDLVIRKAKKLKLIKHQHKPSDSFAPFKQDDKDSQEKGATSEPIRYRDTMILDVTAAPLNLTFPTDSGLLNRSREQCETLIDRLVEADRDLWPTKPRTNRHEVRKAFLSFSKNKCKSKKHIRKAVGKQLRYLRRNLKTLNAMLNSAG